MTFKTTFLAGLCVSLLVTSPLSAQDAGAFVETHEFGTTDWTEGYVEATGQGTSRYMGNRVQEELMAKQAARTTAQARLLEMVKGIRLTGLSTLGAAGLGDTKAATRIKGTLRGAKTVSSDVTWHEDKSTRRGEVALASVTLRVCISPSCAETSGNLVQAALNPAQPAVPEAAAAAVQTDGETSAVIIDLEQALYLPALSPEVINESGDLIYAQEIVTSNQALKDGLIHYAKTVTAAKKLPISGATPMVVTALRITKDNRIVISDQDGQTLSKLAAVQNGRMIVALD